LFRPEDRQKEANPALFQFKSFLPRPSAILLIFNGLEWPPETLAGQMHHNEFLLQRNTASRKQMRLLGIPELKGQL